MNNLAADIIAAKVTDNHGRPHQNEDIELLAMEIAKAAPAEYLQSQGYEGLWAVGSLIRLSPREHHLLKEQLKLIKIDDLLRTKMPPAHPVQQEMFA